MRSATRCHYKCQRDIRQKGVVASLESDSKGCGSDCNGISARQTKTACRVKSERDESENITGPKEDAKGQTRQRAEEEANKTSRFL